MKLLLTVSVCILAFGLVSCGAPSDEYLPPAEVSQEYIPPAVEEPEPAAALGDDGYRYKAIKRLKLRHRRDVSELNSEYLPPAEVSQEYIPPAVEEPEPAATLGDDGYRYKAIKRRRFRHRRDVSELNSEYLPPAEVSQEYIPPAVEEPEPAATLGDDGYRYKAIKRRRFRHRRDVSELNSEYLPPTEVSQEYIPPAVEEPEPAATLGDDGYRYKAIKRRRFRHRRDVSELNSEYLPPTEVSQEYIPPAVEEPEPAATLGDDGYRYKAIKRRRFRNRRDVSELNSEYLPPTEVSQEYIPPAVEEPEPAATLGDDGYRYKAIKRRRFRHRRDVSELNSEYLPPTEVSQEYIPPAVEEPEPAATLGDDGYRYKAIKRRRFRHRRDVSELNSEYLPPAQEDEVAVEQEIAQPEPAHALAADGYRYKTVKRLRFRHRRDVSELNNDYLPPTHEDAAPVEEAAPAPIAEPEPAHELAADGYRYKAVKRYRFRHRRDVSELNNDYLPPTHEDAAPVEEAAPAPIAEPEPAHELAADGYRYKAVKRYRFRHRRDVSELNNDYLPPTHEDAAPVEEAAPAPIAEPEPAHELAADGYRYKTVKRYRFRHRRDVSELNNDYLPPTHEDAAPIEEAAPAPIAEPEPAHELAADGYRYKAVKRYRFRHRRDVSELNNDYLPPTEHGAPAPVEIAPAPVAEPEPAHALGDDGYKYKAIRRIVFRRRY